MQETDLRQEKKYCSRLGWALVLTLVCALVWQFALSLAALLTARFPALWLGMDVFYLLSLVGYYIVALRGTGTGTSGGGQTEEGGEEEDGGQSGSPL